jgi:hypothetical protein
MPTIPQSAPTSPTGEPSGSVQHLAEAESSAAVGDARSVLSESDYANTVDLILTNRVARTQRKIDAGQPVTDDELLQHREDARLLMEMSHDRWLVSHEPSDLALCRRWMERRDEAVRLLSPAWKATREEQIQQDIAASPGGSGCYFIDAGERDRAALASNEPKAQG